MDWKAIARASGLNLSDADLEKVVRPLGALEETLRPVMGGLLPELEPSLEFRADEEGE